MMKHSHLIVIYAALCCIVTDVSGKELIEVFTGNASSTTAEFEAQAPWILDWRVTSEYRTGTSIEVSLVDVETGPFIGYVLTTTGTGNGVKLFNQSGHFYFRVNSNLVGWTLKVEQLSEEEAMLYTPKQPSD